MSLGRRVARLSCQVIWPVIALSIVVPAIADEPARTDGTAIAAPQEPKPLTLPVDSLDAIQSARRNARYGDAVVLARRALARIHPKNVSDSLRTSELDGALVAALLAAGGLAQPETVHLAEQAVGIQERHLSADDPRLAASLLSLAQVHARNHAWALALALAERSRAVSERAYGPDHPSVARAIFVAANARRELGDTEAAERSFRQALAIQERSLGRDGADLAPTLNALAVLLSRKHENDEARRLFRRAIDVVERTRGPDHPSIASALNNYADFEMHQGHFDIARPLQERAVEVLERRLGPDSPVVGIPLITLGELLTGMGDHHEARPIFERALAIQERAYGPTDPSVVTCLLNAGNEARQLGDTTAARTYFLRGLAITRSPGYADPSYVAHALQDLEILALQTGNVARAEALCDTILAMRSAQPDAPPAEVAEALHQLAWARMFRDPASAVEPLERTIRIRRGYLPADHADIGRTMADLGRALLATGATARAESLLTQAAAIYESARGHIEAGLERVTFQHSPYGALTVARLALGRDAEAWAAAEAGRGRVLGDLLVATGTHGAHATSALPMSRIQSALRADEALIGWVDAEPMDGMRGAWIYALRRRGPVVWARVGDAPSDSSPGDLPAIQTLRSLLDEPDGPADMRERMARRVWSSRLRPMERALQGTRTLIVVASGAMSGVPLEALQDDRGRWMSERFVISYAPSATVFASLAEHRGARGRAPDRRPALLVGDPPFNEGQRQAMAAEAPHLTLDPGTRRGADSLLIQAALVNDPGRLDSLPRLPGTRSEVEAIAALAPGSRLLLGAAACEESLTAMASTDRLRGFRLLHFATHAFADGERPERSCLMLSRAGLPSALDAARQGRQIVDGRVTAAEIVRGWRLDADMVTLSACETGLGPDLSGEGIVGLAHALLQSGARSVLVSMWRVDDRATSLLMTRFYEALSRRPAIRRAEALRSARAWLRDYRDPDGRRPYREPFYWAGFVLIGDAD